MSGKTRLSIVLLNFNRLHETQATITRLLELRQQRNDMEIIAVDNGSSDGTADYIKTLSEIKSILLTDNAGIAGYNEGFKLAIGDYILVLDDDSCPDSGQTLTRLIKCLDSNPNIGLLACHINTPDNQQQWSWHLPKQQRFAPSPFFIGCGFVIRRALFEKIGWYPGDFFLYQNEIDVAFKTRLQGYAIYYDPEAIIIHRGTPNQRPGWRRIFYPTRNTIWLLRTYYPQPFAAYLIFSRIIIGLIRAIHFKELKTYAKALKEGFSKPISKNILPPELRYELASFWKQNSLIHQILKWT